MILSNCLFGLFALTAIAPSDAPPDEEILKLDRAQSSAAFSVKVLWMFAVEGHFGNVSGTVSIDHVHGQATVDARINAADVTMRRDGAINWVKSAEFFDVEHFPEIHFHSDPFPIARLHDGGALPGALTMRGMTHAIVFEVQPSDCPRAAIDCPVEAAGSVRRSEFGMQTRRATLSDKVELSFSIRMMDSQRGAEES
ncbi:MAG: YceI family protein [Dokdonella sp.]